MVETGSTRAAIIDATVDLISASGYHTLSMREIAKAAGIRAPSLYNHFSSKDDLVAAAVRERHPFVTLAPQLSTLEGDTPEMLLSQAASLVVAVVDARPALLDLLLAELVDLRGVHLAAIIPDLMHMIGPLIDKIEAVAAPRLKCDRAQLSRAFGAMLLSHLVLKHRTQLAPNLTADINMLLHGALDVPR